jgi:hypothetical protein
MTSTKSPQKTLNSWVRNISSSLLALTVCDKVTHDEIPCILIGLSIEYLDEKELLIISGLGYLVLVRHMRGLIQNGEL